MNVGDTIERRYGPFIATAEVVAITDAGAVLRVNDDARLVGYEHPTVAPNGTELADAGPYDFVGRAHWDSP